MDYDKIAEIFLEEGLTNAEVVFYNRNETNVVKNTIRFDMTDKDYHWSVSYEPINLGEQK